VTEPNIPAEAPDFTLDHILGHSVSLGDFRGQTVVAMFVGKESAAQTDGWTEKIRGQYDPLEMPILGVSDLRAVPRPARIVARKLMKKAFDEVVEQESAAFRQHGKEPPDDPGKFVQMLLDWKGEVTGSFGIDSVEETAVGVVIDGDGRILASGTGPNAGDTLFAALPPK
jgi:hypothetical protein